MSGQLTISRLSASDTINHFDCTDTELNNFLCDDAIDHIKALLAVTYLLERDGELIGYFSVLNDSIRHKDIPAKTPSRSELKRLLRKVPFKKRGYQSHPAVKVGRFAISKDCQSNGLGSKMMDYIKGYFLDNNKTGCRFITVDAYNNPKTLKFYQDNGFDFLTSKDETEDNRLMYFDLIVYSNYLNGH
ncbi:MAG: GNAT family N-acetyltransferase [Syntrophorhabdaceae bacterium]|nr:GNAT family N-acetyltransferase [Syntrophorhabdaceae bacterium]